MLPSEQSDSEPVYLSAYERRMLDWAISAAPWRFFLPGPTTDAALLSAQAKLRGLVTPVHRRTGGWIDYLCRRVRHLRFEILWLGITDDQDGLICRVPYGLRRAGCRS